MDIALLLVVVNCESDILIDRTLYNLHDSVTLCIVECSNLVFYHEFIHKLNFRP